MELTGCSQADASTHLNVSPATLSRAFGDRRIPAELKAKADQLPQSSRSLIAAVPAELMGRAIDFALTPGADGKRPTRDAVALHIRQLKREGKPSGSKPKAIPLRFNGRLVTVRVAKNDNATSVSEDLKALATKLGKLTERSTRRMGLPLPVTPYPARPASRAVSFASSFAPSAQKDN